MTPEQRKAARARCEAASGEPWFVSDIDGEPTETIASCYIWQDGSTTGKENDGILIDRTHATVADMVFIAHARTDLPQALDYIDTLLTDLESIQKRGCDGPDHCNETWRCGACQARYALAGYHAEVKS